MSAVVAYMVMKNRRVKAAKRASEQGVRPPSANTRVQIGTSLCAVKEPCGATDYDVVSQRGVPAQPERVPDTVAARAKYEVRSYLAVHLARKSSLDGVDKFLGRNILPSSYVHMAVMQGMSPLRKLHPQGSNVY